MEELSCHFHKTKRSNILQNKIGQFFFLLKRLKFEGLFLLIIITKPILLIIHKPAVFSSRAHGSRVPPEFSLKSEAHHHSVKGEKG